MDKRLTLRDGRHRRVPAHYSPRPAAVTGWPVIPAPLGATVIALTNQMLEHEWDDPEDIRARQLRQLRHLLEHAAAQSPFHAERMEAAGIDPSEVKTTEDLRRLPLMRRTDLQDDGKRIIARKLPKGMRAKGQLFTSGATAAPVRVHVTNFSALVWAANTVRNYVWAGLDPMGTLASIRTIGPDLPDAMTSRGAEVPHWGGSTAQTFATGPAHVMSIDLDVETHLALVQRVNPDYLLAYPTCAVAMGELIAERGIVLDRLKTIQTISETTTPERRELIERHFGVPVFDVYSCTEVGYIATNCPANAGYHVHDENVLVEVLDENDEPSRPGEAGRIVLTSLVNFVFPLIRYDIGDYAVPTAPGACPCGRGLSGLSEVIGRMRSQLIAPDGSIKFANALSVAIRGVGGIRQFQFIQHERDRVQLRIVPLPHFGQGERGSITRAIRAHLGAEVQVVFDMVEKIERTPGGKYLDFISHAH